MESLSTQEKLLLTLFKTLTEDEQGSIIGEIESLAYKHWENIQHSDIEQ